MGVGVGKSVVHYDPELSAALEQMGFPEAHLASHVLRVLRLVRDECPDDWDRITKTESGVELTKLWDRLRACSAQERKIKLELNYEEDLIVRGALSEFIAVRTPRGSIDEYVQQRYPASEGFDDKWREYKVKDVQKRVQRATEIRERLFDAS